MGTYTWYLHIIHHILGAIMAFWAHIKHLEITMILPRRCVAIILYHAIILTILLTDSRIWQITTEKLEDTND